MVSLKKQNVEITKEIDELTQKRDALVAKLQEKDAVKAKVSKLQCTIFANILPLLLLFLVA